MMPNPQTLKEISISSAAMMRAVGGGEAAVVRN